MTVRAASSSLCPSAVHRTYRGGRQHTQSSALIEALGSQCSFCGTELRAAIATPR
jgi:hypothetical protein